jgi:endoglucanase
MKKEVKSRIYGWLAGLSAVCIGYLSPAQSAVETWGQLRVQGPDIVSESGEPIQLQGMSLFWSQWEPEFYEYNTIKWLRDDWCSNIIRASIGIQDNGDYYDTQANQEARARTVIEAAIDLNIYVLVDWHAHYATRNKAAAIDFFTKIARDYGSYPNIIYEPFNEPIGYDWNTLKSYHQDLVAAIRQHDPDNIIVCGTPEYSAYPNAPIGNPVSGSNIAYTLHYYAGSHFQDFRDRANAARSNNLCVFVTEYGTVNADGNGNVNEGSSNDWWNWMYQNKISHCNWSLCDKNEGSAALTPGTPAGGSWSSTQLTWSGGLVRSYLKSKCPVYDPPVPDVLIIPGKVEAESYSTMSGIQKENTTDAGGGKNVGYIDANDWLEYKVNAIGTGTYQLRYRVASQPGGGSFKLLLDGNEVHTVTVSATGGWQTWNDITRSINIPTRGNHTLRIVAISGGWNLNYLDFTASGYTDCNNDLNGTAIIDDCNVCSGGNTGKAINACQGNCVSGYSPVGIKDKFDLAAAPFTAQGGVYSFGEASLGGDANPEFQALLVRNLAASRLDITVSQGLGKFVPFGFDFGTAPVKTIDLSGDAKFELELKNTSSSSLKISLAIQDVNNRIINTYATASGKPFADAWKYAIETNLNANASLLFKGDFKNGYYANYATSAYVSTFDYTKVKAILITVTNQLNTGAPDYKPLALSNATLAIEEIKLGDCSAASYDNGRDCNGDLNGTAAIDICNVCSGGKTGILVDNCVLSVEEETAASGSYDSDKIREPFSLYPNPSSSLVNLSRLVHWTMYNSLGEAIMEGEGKQIDISTLAPGIYVVQSGIHAVRLYKR